MPCVERLDDKVRREEDQNVMAQYQQRENRNENRTWRDEERSNEGRRDEGRRRELGGHEREERWMSPMEGGEQSWRRDEGRFGGSEYSERSRGFDPAMSGRFHQGDVSYGQQFGQQFGHQSGQQPYAPQSFGSQVRGQGYERNFERGFESEPYGERFGGGVQYGRDVNPNQGVGQGLPNRMMQIGQNVGARFSQDVQGRLGRLGEEESFSARGIGERGFRGKGPKGYLRSDERIKEEVCDLLTDHPSVDATEIEVQVKQGEVILSGTVNSRDEKRFAEDIIESLSGVKEVNNQLRIHKQEVKSGNGQEQIKGQQTNVQKNVPGGQPPR